MLNGCERCSGARVTDRKRLVCRIQELNFALTEANMYLDVYNSVEALRYRQNVSNELDDAIALYEKDYGPLTIAADARNGKHLWTETPWPWESEAN